MIVEYIYSPQDLKKRCYGCKWLKLYDDFNGKCECPYNHVKFRDRDVLEKSCTWKNADITKPNANKESEVVK